MSDLTIHVPASLADFGWVETEPGNWTHTSGYEIDVTGPTAVLSTFWQHDHYRHWSLAFAVWALTECPDMVVAAS